MRRRTVCLLTTALAVLPAAAQEGPYRSVAYDDPYFIRPAPPAPTPTFTGSPAPAPSERPDAVAPPRLALAAPTLPSRTPAAAPRAPMRPATRPAQAMPAAPEPKTGRVMRGRVEAVVGWDRLRGDEPIDAVVYGVAAGADRMVGHVGGGAVFLGPYAAARFSQAEASTTARTETTSGTQTVATETASATSEEREIELGVRVGWATDRTALYVAGGYVNARAGTATQTTATVIDAATMTQTTDQESEAGTTHRDGWRIGAGTEVTVTGDLFWKADYGYTAFDEAEDRHQVTTGVGLRF